MRTSQGFTEFIPLHQSDCSSAKYSGSRYPSVPWTMVDNHNWSKGMSLEDPKSDILATRYSSNKIVSDISCSLEREAILFTGKGIATVVKWYSLGTITWWVEIMQINPKPVYPIKNRGLAASFALAASTNISRIETLGVARKLLVEYKKCYM
ncbi:hypothetical protein AKJ16_DCAP04009 [Drosera capensis]